MHLHIHIDLLLDSIDSVALFVMRLDLLDFNGFVSGSVPFNSMILVS